VTDFEVAVANGAQRHVSGVVWAHPPRRKRINNVLYCNDGDWVENHTAGRAYGRHAGTAALGAGDAPLKASMHPFNGGGMKIADHRCLAAAD
jgi:hypothetical protein